MLHNSIQQTCIVIAKLNGDIIDTETAMLFTNTLSTNKIIGAVNASVTLHAPITQILTGKSYAAKQMLRADNLAE